jgi:transcriptional regulator with XRE-family HTH domain
MEYRIGKKIRAFREEKGLSQLKLAEALEERGIKMSRETLSKIENNSRSISAVELKAIADVLGVDIDEFFHEEEHDSMVTFFRKDNYSQDVLEDIKELQEMVKVFIQNKRMYLEKKDK